MAIDGGTGNPIVGDLFTVAGDTSEYVVTAVTGASPITFSPSAKVAWADNAAVTFVADHVANIAGHPNGLAQDSGAFAQFIRWQTSVDAANAAPKR